MLSDNAQTILNKRYLHNGETPEQMFRRVAKHVAQDNYDQEESYFELMNSLKFLPNSPTLFNAGTGQGSLSACFALVPDDTMESIMQVGTDLALIQKWGGGTGFGFSRIRAKGSHISSTHGHACGPVEVLKSYARISEMITQGGKRQGANMGMLFVNHPDIREFIHLKDDGITAQNFNLSVLGTDEFMQEVKAEGQSANKLWEEIIQLAWATGDPGFGFIDTVNRSEYKLDEFIEASNPCGEEYLENYGSCNLGSINLSKFVQSPISIDWLGLKEVVELAVHFLNDVIDVNEFPVDRLSEVNHRTRRIGLGVMGWHDMLLKLRLQYDSEAAVNQATAFMKAITSWALAESAVIAQKKGTIPNTSVTTIAPTGSLAAIAGCSFGIEPVFAWEQEKHILDGETLLDIHPIYTQAKEEGWYTSELFKSANEIPWWWHVKMQAAFQAHTTNSVSKTINLPKSATVEEVGKAYMMAWELGCKGITVYRDGSKQGQVLVDATKKVIDTTGRLVRPQSLDGSTVKIPTGDGNIYVTINFLDDRPVEIFTAGVGKSGSCSSALAEGLTRAISLGLRRGIEVEEFIDQLAEIACHPAINGAKSIPDAVAKALGSGKIPIRSNGNICPKCGNGLVHQENCEHCSSCDYNRC